DGKRLCTSGLGSLRLWDVKGPKPLAQVYGDGPAAFSPGWYAACELCSGNRALVRHRPDEAGRAKEVSTVNVGQFKSETCRAGWRQLHSSYPVYELLGKEGLPATEMPKVDRPVMGTVGYHIRTGKHDVTRYEVSGVRGETSRDEERVSST